jgi:gluconate 5-dehydrogenase
MSQLFSVEGQVVHVSGGSRGIGRKIAEAFSEAGAKVVVSSRTEADLKATGLCYQVCDIMDAGQVERCVNTIVAQFGRLDVLFNVAGVNFRHAAETFPVEKLDDILAVNVRGNYLMARACGRVMVEQKKGKIVNIASLHTMQSLAGVSAYGTSKGAIGSMTRALAVEWAAHNVQVNAIAPGFIITDLNRKLWDDPKMRTWVEDRTPVHRLGEPSDLVGAAIFLASAASDFVTGQVLSVDGGFNAGSTWPLAVPR